MLVDEAQVYGQSPIVLQAGPAANAADTQIDNAPGMAYGELVSAFALGSGISINTRIAAAHRGPV